MRGKLKNLVVDLSFFDGWKHLRLHPPGCPCNPFVWLTAASHMLGHQLFISVGAFGFAAQAVLFFASKEELARAGTPVQKAADPLKSDPVASRTKPPKTL